MSATSIARARVEDHRSSLLSSPRSSTSARKSHGHQPSSAPRDCDYSWDSAVSGVALFYTSKNQMSWEGRFHYPAGAGTTVTHNSGAIFILRSGRRLPSRRRPGPVSEIFMGGAHLHGLTDADFKKADAAKDKR